MVNAVGLNEEQYQAVFSIKGPIVVCAGAGSGKTRVIAFRVLHLVNSGVLPYLITCVTFTNKAAREMKERIYQLLADFQSFPIITTFHGYALQLIRLYGARLGFAQYTILGEDQQELIIKNIFKALDIKDKNCTPKKVLSGINFIKNNYFVDVGSPADIDAGLFQRVYQLYEEEKRKCCLLDFDDLLIIALKLLREKDILELVRKNTKHVMIDEYQDTNSIQHALVKLLTLCPNGELAMDSLLVVGDEDQSIYSWRGANVSNILHFKRDFPDAKYLKLTRNYRSTKTILSLANAVIQKNSFRNKKELWTDRHSERSAFLIEFQSGYQEAESLIRTIKRLRHKYTNYSCAILYRSHYQSRLFEECCVSQNVPYKIYGGLNFYQRQEIKDILAYVYLSVNNLDKQSFLRCCNVPQRGFGDVAQEEFIAFWQCYDIGITDIIPLYLAQQKVSIKIKSALLFILDIIETVSKFDNPAQAILYIIQKTEYHQYIDKNAENELEMQSRKENLEELIAAAKSFSNEHSGSIVDFVDYLSVLYEKSEENTELENRSPLLLMSIHAAKGLEFNIVCIVGLEDGIFPSGRSQGSNESLEEERRLLYVAITRAEDILICSYAQMRSQWGGPKVQYPSCFLNDFDQRYCQKLSYKKMTLSSIERIVLDNLSC